MFAKNWLRVVVALTLVFGTSVPCHAIVVNFTNPTADTPYGIGATITYNGDGSWSNQEQTLTSIQIELRFDNATTGTIIDSESASITVNANDKTFTYINPTPAALAAGQDAGHHSSTYYLVGIPYGPSQPYLKDGQTYRKSVTLGDIE